MRSRFPKHALPRATRFLLFSSCMFLALAGCKEPEPDWVTPVHPVKGKLTVAGAPQPDVVIIFHPVDKAAVGTQVLPRAKTDDQGNFQVTTFESFDGAPEGKYRLAFSWQGPLAGLSEEEQDLLKERLKAKYLKAETAGFEVTIEATDNELAPIDLQ